MSNPFSMWGVYTTHQTLNIYDLILKLCPAGVTGPTGASGLGGSNIGEPVGFLTPQNVGLSIDDEKRTLTITPTSGTYTYFVGGLTLQATSPQTVTWSTDNGLHYFYFDELGILQTTITFTTELITKYCIVSIVYWDSIRNKSIYFADERHGIHMGTSTHLYLHNTRGAQFDTGLKLVNFVVDGNGSSNSHAQFTSESGIIWDEDIKLTILPQTQYPVFYRLGTVWKMKMPDAFPLIYEGQEGYVGTTLAYNRELASIWSLQPVDSNKFVLIHVFATNNIPYPIVVILGIQQYNNKVNARNGVKIETQQLSGLPFLEFTPVGSVIYETSNAYTNIPKARVVSTDNGDNYEDERGNLFRPGTMS